VHCCSIGKKEREMEGKKVIEHGHDERSTEVSHNRTITSKASNE